MVPANTRAKTNHKEVVDGDSLYSLQQQLTPSAFMPQRDHTLGVTLPSTSTPLGGQPRLPPTATALTDEPQHQPLPHHKPIVSSKTAQSYIASSKRVLPPKEIAPKVILITAFLVILDELLDRRERRVIACVTRLANPYRTEEATSSPRAVPLYAPPPHVFPLLASAATQGTRATMTLPLDLGGNRRFCR